MLLYGEKQAHGGCLRHGFDVPNDSFDADELFGINFRIAGFSGAVLKASALRTNFEF